MNMGRGPIVRLFLITLALLLIPLVAISSYALQAFERSLLPELDKKAQTVGMSVSAQIERAMAFAIPFERLEGMREFFLPVLNDNEDISYLAVTDREGNVLYAAGLPSEQTADLQRATSEILGETPDGFAPQPAATPEQGLLDPLISHVDDLLQSNTGLSLSELRGRIGVLLGESTEQYAMRAKRMGAFFNTALPIALDGEVLGVLHVGADERFVARKMLEILFDIGIVLVVSLLVAFELLLLIVTTNFSGPIRLVEAVMRQVAHGNFSHVPAIGNDDEIGRLGRKLNNLVLKINGGYRELLALSERVRAARPELAVQARVANTMERLKGGFTFGHEGRPEAYRQSRLINVRTLTFLFVFAEEIARPFFPVYVRGLASEVNVSWLSQDLLIGLPISVFMLVMALSMPAIGFWSDRVGRRQTFMIGAALSTAGLVGTALAPEYFLMILSRSVSAVGYAMTFVACQGYIMDNTTLRDRTQGVAVFVGGIMAADICGPAIGGILADRIGYGSTFLVGAGLAALAAVLVTRFMAAGTHNEPSRREPIRAADFHAVLTNPRFLILMLFAAIPAKVLLTGFLFYLVPLALTEFGNTQSEIGRIAMTYGIAAVALTPVFARLADRLQGQGFMVGVGGMIAGAGMIPILFTQSTNGVLLGVVLLGIGQAISVSPQIALSTQVCREQIEARGQASVLGVYRLIERVGSAAGPFVVAGFVASFGYAGAMAAIGVYGFVTAVIFSAAFLMMGFEPEEEDDLQFQASEAQARA